MATMRVAQVSRPKGPFEFVERPIPQPGPGWVRIKVQACGVCHSDSMFKDGLYPGVQFPCVLGHEVAGTRRRGGPGRRVVEAWAARGRGLVRRKLRPLRAVPARESVRLPVY